MYNGATLLQMYPLTLGMTKRVIIDTNDSIHYSKTVTVFSYAYYKIIIYSLCSVGFRELATVIWGGAILCSCTV